MWKFWWQTFHDFADQGTSENVNYVVEFSDELCQNEWETGDYSWLLDMLWWGGDVTQTHLHCIARVYRYVFLVHHAHVLVVGRLHRSRAQLSPSLTGRARHAALGRSSSVCQSNAQFTGLPWDRISIPIPIPYPQKIPQDPHTHRTPKSYIPVPVPAPCLFTTRAPLELWPYGLSLIHISEPTRPY